MFLFETFAPPKKESPFSEALTHASNLVSDLQKLNELAAAGWQKGKNAMEYKQRYEHANANLEKLQGAMESLLKGGALNQAQHSALQGEIKKWELEYNADFPSPSKYANSEPRAKEKLGWALQGAQAVLSGLQNVSKADTEAVKDPKKKLELEIPRLEARLEQLQGDIAAARKEPKPRGAYGESGDDLKQAKIDALEQKKSQINAELGRKKSELETLNKDKTGFLAPAEEGPAVMPDVTVESGKMKEDAVTNVWSALNSGKRPEKKDIEQALEQLGKVKNPSQKVKVAIDDLNFLADPQARPTTDELAQVMRDLQAVQGEVYGKKAGKAKPGDKKAAKKENAESLSVVLPAIQQQLEKGVVPEKKQLDNAIAQLEKIKKPGKAVQDAAADLKYFSDPQAKPTAQDLATAASDVKKANGELFGKAKGEEKVSELPKTALKMLPIDAMPGEFKNFTDWLKTQFKDTGNNAFAHSRLNSTLLQVMDYSVEQGWLSQVNVDKLKSGENPDFASPQGKKELTMLMNVFSVWAGRTEKIARATFDQLKSATAPYTLDEALAAAWHPAQGSVTAGSNIVENMKAAAGAEKITAAKSIKFWNNTFSKIAGWVGAEVGAATATPDMASTITDNRRTDATITNTTGSPVTIEKPYEGAAGFTKLVDENREFKLQYYLTGVNGQRRSLASTDALNSAFNLYFGASIGARDFTLEDAQDFVTSFDSRFKNKTLIQPEEIQAFVSKYATDNPEIKTRQERGLGLANEPVTTDQQAQSVEGQRLAVDSFNGAVDNAFKALAAKYQKTEADGTQTFDETKAQNDPIYAAFTEAFSLLQKDAQGNYGFKEGVTLEQVAAATSKLNTALADAGAEATGAIEIESEELTPPEGGVNEANSFQGKFSQAIKDHIDATYSVNNAQLSEENKNLIIRSTELYYSSQDQSALNDSDVLGTVDRYIYGYVPGVKRK